MSVQLTTSGVLIRARSLTGFASLVDAHGGDAAALFEAAGVPRHALDTPDVPVSMADLMALLNRAARELNAPDLGLQLAQRQDITVLGAVALIAQHSATVGEACAAIARHLPYHSPGMAMHIENDAARPGYTQFRLVLQPGRAVEQRQGVELAVGVMHRFLRMVTGDAGDGWHLSLRHAGAVPGVRYGDYFGGPVLLEQADDKLSIPSHLLQVEVAPGQQALRMAAERHVGNLTRRFPLDITQQVEALVERHLAAGGGSLVQIARELGLHERTLQRRLKERAVFFEDIVDRLRRCRAEEYLSYQAIPLAEVAAMLGYSEQSSFVRGCKRWFGTTPRNYRSRCVRGAMK